MTDPLLPFQEQVVQEIDRYKGRCLLALGMGLGKTYVSLEWLCRHPGSLPAVVVCPASVKWHWQSEAINRVGMSAEVLEGRRPPAGRRMTTRHRLIVINYDIISSYLQWLKGLGIRTVIVDECQYIANRTKRTTAVRSLCRGVPHVLALSGTPLVNRPIELFNTLQILKPKHFTSRWSFAQEFCSPRRTPWGWKFDGAANLPTLRKRLLGYCMIRRRKADVLPELPPKVREVIPVSIEDRERYEHARDDFIGWLRKEAPGKVRGAERAHALVKMGYLKRLAARLKVKSVLEWIRTFYQGSDEKLVVFAVHRRMVELIREGAGVESVEVTGRVTGRRRRDAVAQFQRNRRTRLLVGNIRAAGVGITLTAASTVAFAELDWTPGAHTQAEDRIHRIGTRGTAFITYLVARGTIEEDLCELIQRKQRVLSAVLDGGGAGETLSVFDLLMDRMRLGAGVQ